MCWSRCARKAAAWPAVAGELVLHGPLFLVMFNKEGFELSLGPAVLEQMELKGVGGGGTESSSVILPRTRP